VGDSGIIANESAASPEFFGNRLQRQAFQTRTFGLKMRFAGSNQEDGIVNLIRELPQTRASISLGCRCPGE
jgi:hypothetical protein